MTALRQPTAMARVETVVHRPGGDKTVTETSVTQTASTQSQPASGSQQSGGAATPARLVQYKAGPLESHDNSPGSLTDTCFSCYGAQRFFYYYIADAQGNPIIGDFKFTEHVTFTDPKPKNSKLQTSPEHPSNGLIKDRVGASSDKPIKVYHSATDQRFSVVFNGKTYWLTTLVNQIIDKTKNGWTIQAVVANK
jgi:hypothetical protein